VRAGKGSAGGPWPTESMELFPSHNGRATHDHHSRSRPNPEPMRRKRFQTLLQEITPAVNRRQINEMQGVIHPPAVEEAIPFR